MAEQSDKSSSTPPSISSKYVLISVEKTEAPEGLPGTNWHEYIIERGNSQIVGKKPGTLKQVNEHADAMITDLNERSGIPSSSTYASRQISKPKEKTTEKTTETKTSEPATKDSK
ncbi:MAG: hypothetical protein ACC653_01190 [Gammaproteobacteria bacterium]